MGLFAPVRDYVETLVHPSAQQDALTASRHRAFIAPRLLGSIVALASFPVYLFARGAPSAIELMVFAWLVVPILTAYFLSRTGRYESAHVLSSLALTGLVTAVAASTGGIVSFAAIWLVVVPLEAALSASRRVVATASTLALGAAGLLVLLDAQHLLPTPEPELARGARRARHRFGSALCGGACARRRGAGAHQLLAALRRGRPLSALGAQYDRRDHAARPRRRRAVHVAGRREALFGSRIADLHGHGLFDRVHVADRPAYLTALGDAAALAESRSVEFRVRRDGVDGNGHPATEFVWIEMRCRPLEQAGADAGEEGRREVVAVLRDVTGRKQQQQALEDARAEAERANAAKSRFLATMSHELRTPLNAIIGFSEMLKREAALMLDAKRRNEYAGLINDSGNHLLSVVNGILDMSKIETDNFEITPEPFNPAQVIASCCDILALRAREAGVHLEQTGARRSAGHRRRQARAQPDHVQSSVERDPLHRTRRQGSGQRPRRGGQHHLRGRGQRRRHQRRGFGAGRRAVFSGRRLL